MTQMTGSKEYLIILIHVLMVIWFLAKASVFFKKSVYLGSILVITSQRISFPMN